jgi:hypothetical protein
MKDAPSNKSTRKETDAEDDDAMWVEKPPPEILSAVSQPNNALLSQNPKYPQPHPGRKKAADYM